MAEDIHDLSTNYGGDRKNNKTYKLSVAISGEQTTAGGIAVAQISTVTPSDVEIGDVFELTINSSVYSFEATAATVKNVVEGLKALVDAGSEPVTATEDDAVLTITANVAGTPFTISGSVTTGDAGFVIATPTPNVLPTETLTVSGVLLANDSVIASLVDTGTNKAKLISAKVTANNQITFTFDIDPGNDAKYSYIVFKK